MSDKSNNNAQLRYALFGIREWEIGDGSWIMAHGEPKTEEGRRESATGNSTRMTRIRTAGAEIEKILATSKISHCL
jgi:hypothetical protein